MNDFKKVWLTYTVFWESLTSQAQEKTSYRVFINNQLISAGL